MSEYQYYEFLAVDKPLTSAQVAEVRNFSSRAKISSTHFQNEYHWGDFRGSVENFLACYYDLHIYFANWGTRLFALSIPAAAFSQSIVKPFLVKGIIDALRKNDRAILSFHSDSEDGDWDDEGDEWMPELAPVREEFLAGDLRPLYIAWLSALQLEEVETDMPSPPVPPGLRTLTASQQSLAKFLRLDRDLLEVAGEYSPERIAETPDAPVFLKSLPTAEKDRMLLEVLEGNAATTMRELRARLRAATPSLPNAASPAAAELLKEASARSKRREQLAAEKRARERVARAAEAAAAKAAHLRDIAPHSEQLWKTVETRIDRTQPKFYEQAIATLMDLRDLAAAENKVPAFFDRLSALRQRHAKKPAFLQRMKKAGLLPA